MATKKLENVETLYLFRIKNEEGDWEYSAPRSPRSLDQLIKSSGTPGEVCLCYIVPDFEVKVEVTVPWEDSQFEQADNNATGAGGSVNGSEISEGEDSALRAEIAEVSRGFGDDLEAGASEVLDSIGEDL